MIHSRKNAILFNKDRICYVCTGKLTLLEGINHVDMVSYYYNTTLILCDLDLYLRSKAWTHLCWIRTEINSVNVLGSITEDYMYRGVLITSTYVTVGTTGSDRSLYLELRQWVC